MTDSFPVTTAKPPVVALRGFGSLSKRIDQSGGPDACWPWLGAKTKQGYGLVWLPGNTSTTAIRAVYEACIGPIPSGYVIDHIECDNPPCCNPRHLKAVTQQENILRGTSPSAVCARQTHCKNGHPFEAGNVRINTQGRRICLACASPDDDVDALFADVARRSRSWEQVKREAAR